MAQEDDEYAWLDEKVEIRLGHLDWLVGDAINWHEHTTKWWKRSWGLWNIKYGWFGRRYYSCHKEENREKGCVACEMWAEVQALLGEHWEE